MLNFQDFNGFQKFKFLTIFKNSKFNRVQKWIRFLTVLLTYIVVQVKTYKSVEKFNSRQISANEWTQKKIHIDKQYIHIIQNEMRTSEINSS